MRSFMSENDARIIAEANGENFDPNVKVELIRQTEATVSGSAVVGITTDAIPVDVARIMSSEDAKWAAWHRVD